MSTLDDGPYGHTMPELRRSTIEKALAAIELQRARRMGLVPTKVRSKARKDAPDIHAAFRRAAREQRELMRLKASGRPWACLDFHPELLDQPALVRTPARVTDGVDAAAADDVAAHTTALAAER